MALQTGEGLRAAHSKGVVHRDVKPGNVIVSPSGQVKLMDFGLAHLAGRTRLTKSGSVLGTPSYMSPEQVRGDSLDSRTDIWSLGVVFYEMISGRSPFARDAAQGVCYAILNESHEPLTALRADVTLDFDRIAGKALAKDRDQRYQHVDEMLVDLRALARGSRPPHAVARRDWRRVAIAGLTGLAAGCGLYAFVSWRLDKEPVPAAITRFTITLPADEVVSPVGRSSVNISADGSRLVWAGADGLGRTKIYHRKLEETESTVLTEARGGVAPTLSPDNQWVAYYHPATRTVKKIAVAGGAPTTISPVESTLGPTWGPGDNIYLATAYPSPLNKVPASGGSAEPVTQLDTSKEERLHGDPSFLPGGKAILFVAAGGGMDTYDDARIAVHSLETGKRKILIEGGMAAQYSPTGHIVFARGGKLLAVPFDAERLDITGPPTPVLDGVFMCVNTGTAHYSLARNGTLAYAPGLVLGGNRQVAWVDRKGNVELLPLPGRPYLHPRLSPDGKKLAIEIEGPVHDFWSYEFDRNVLTKMTLEGSSHWPLWTPDGSRLTYRRWLQGAFSMWWMPSDRGASAERLTDVGRMQSASSWSLDGKTVAFTQVSLQTGPDIYVMSLPDKTPRPFAESKFAEGAARFSPDGRWISYVSNESGRNEIYAQAYPGPGAKIQISTEGGTDALWKRSGGELYYRDGDKMMAVEVNTARGFRASKPRLLWTGRFAHGMGSGCGPPGTTSTNYDVSADGERFLMIKHDEEAPRRLVVVLNWTQELKRLAASNR